MDPLRQQLINLLTVRQAHMSFEDAVAEFPRKHINTKPLNVDYTFWHLIEHIRRTQLDILEYCINPDYQEMKWPDDYWPAQDEIATWKDWQTTIKNFQTDLKKLVKLIKNPQTDFLKPIPWAQDKSHNILREINVVAAHNAYHIGELGILRQITQTWPKSRK